MCIENLLKGTEQKLSCNSPFQCFSPKIASVLTYSSLTSTIYEENMLTHQAFLKESICEEIFPITCIKIGAAPHQLISWLAIVSY